MADTITSTGSSTVVGRRRREAITGYLYILPAFLIVSIFGVFPIGYAIYMSLYRWKIKQGKFVGFQNYERLLGNGWLALVFLIGLALVLVAHWLWVDAFKTDSSKKRLAKIFASLLLIASAFGIIYGWRGMMMVGDKKFLISIVRTVFYAFMTIPIQISLALAIAYMLFQNVKFSEFYRMLFFLPYITPAVAVSVVFRAIFSPRKTSLANQVLGLFGVTEFPRWLLEKKPALTLLFGNQIDAINQWLTTSGANWQIEGLWLGPSLALVVAAIFGIWTYTGYNVIIFLAGLGGISNNVYEAADIDGANNFEKFWHITIPLLAPVTFYLTILGFIGALQAFTHVFVMKVPAVGSAMDVASIHIFETFFNSNNFSKAAAESILLFIVILLITIIQNRILGRKALDG